MGYVISPKKYRVIFHFSNGYKVLNLTDAMHFFVSLPRADNLCVLRWGLKQILPDGF